MGDEKYLLDSKTICGGEGRFTLSNIHTERRTSLINTMEHPRRADRGSDWPAMVVAQEPQVIGLEKIPGIW